MLERNFFACFYFPYCIFVLHFCTSTFGTFAGLFKFQVAPDMFLVRVPSPLPRSHQSSDPAMPLNHICTSDSVHSTNQQRGKSFWKSFPFGTPLLLGGLDRSGASPTLTQAGLECKGFYIYEICTCLKMASRTSWQDLLSTTLPSPVTSSISYFDKNRPSFCILHFYSVTSWILAHCYNAPHLGSELTCRTPSSYLRCFHCHSWKSKKPCRYFEVSLVLPCITSLLENPTVQCWDMLG